MAHLRRTLKEAVAETLHERPRPEKPSLRVVEHLQQMLFTPDGTTKEAASGLESEVRRLVQENQRLALAMERTEEQLKAGSDAAAKATLKIKTIGEAPEVVQGMEQRPARHAAHAAHVVRHATAELKHELAVAHARIAELEAAAPAPRACSTRAAFPKGSSDRRPRRSSAFATRSRVRRLRQRTSRVTRCRGCKRATRCWVASRASMPWHRRGSSARSRRTPSIRSRHTSAG